MKHNTKLGLLVFLYFILSYLYLPFALLGILCMILPFVVLYKTKTKRYCQGYCPRSHSFTYLHKLRRTTTTLAPKWLRSTTMKEIMLTYFIFSMIVVAGSTLMVALNRIDPILSIKLFFFIEFPISPLFTNIPIPWLTHLAYRVLSMFTSTTLLGFTLAFLYPPRTWCIICPIQRISTSYLKR